MLAERGGILFQMRPEAQVVMTGGLRNLIAPEQKTQLIGTRCMTELTLTT